MKYDDIKFSPLSLIDDFGRVFFKNGRVYRAINNDKKEFCIDFLNSPLFTELSNKNLIPKTQLTDINVEGFGLVLEHEKLLQTYQHEWSFDMFKDAALMLLEINTICHKYGYELKDGHPYNILFKGTKPLYVDFGSIVLKVNKAWTAYNEFVEAFAVPLFFWNEGNTYVVRKLLASYPYKMFTIPEKTLISSYLLTLLDNNPFRYRIYLKNKFICSTIRKYKLISLLIKLVNAFTKRITVSKARYLSYQGSYIPLSRLIEKLEKIKAPNQISIWQNYHLKIYENSESDEPTYRFSRILELIKEREDQIESVVDLAGNSGYFCSLLAKKTKISKIILSDYDENAINSAYNRFKKEDQLKKIYTVLLNFMVPVDMIGTPRRFKADAVLALAITHHLLLTNKYSISAILDKIKDYANKFVFIEFMPLGLWDGNDDYPSIPAWYNINWFRKEFCKVFILQQEEMLEVNRILFVGKPIDY